MWMCAAQSTVRFKKNKDMAKEVIGKGWITVAAINDGQPGPPGSPGSPGKPGSDGKDALTVSVSPEVIVLHAVKVSDSNYNVTNFSTAQARIAVFRGGTNVSPQCTLSDVEQQYCRAAASGLTISITAVSQNVVDGMRIPYTDARVMATVNYVENGHIERLYVTIGVKVEVSAIWGRFERNLSVLSSKYSELSNTVNGLPLKDDAALTKYTSEIKQSAREISAKVAQETVGRLNVLPGTAFNRETDVEQLNSYFPCKIEPLGGLEGTGAMVASQTGATTTTWCGLVWKGVVLKPSTWYTISVWARVDGGLDDVMYLGLRQVGASDAMSYLILAQAGETHEWKLFSHTFQTGSTAESCNNVTIEMGMRKNGTGRCCKLMLDESETYNGWTPASYADVSSRALLATGIDITNRAIDMTADKFTLRNNHGEKSFGVDEDGNLEARSLRSVSKDGSLTAVIKDGAFTASSGLSGATAFFGLIDGMPYLQFTNAAGVVCYAIGPSGGQASGKVGVQMTTCGVGYSVSTMSLGGKSSYMISYSGSVTLQNFGSESANIYQSKLQLIIDGFTQTLTASFKDSSFPMTEVGQGKVMTLMPGKLMQAEFEINHVTESMPTTGSDGSYLAKPSGARGCQLKLNGEVIGKGEIR
nr:MAG TPA: nucleoid-associated protein [Caudoviricetes sp.]